MPRGTPKSGIRRTKKWMERNAGPLAEGVTVSEKLALASRAADPNVGESDAQIETRLDERFDVLDVLVRQTVDGDCRALIVSGPPGLGKSFTVEKVLDDTVGTHEFVKGYVRNSGLFKLLYKHRAEGSVLVFDDADSIFYDTECLNTLKAVCDTTDRRMVTWGSEYEFTSEDGETIPNRFEFEGSIIFLTNLNFDDLIDRGHKLAPHLAALVSRAHYIDLTLRTRRDFMVRIKQIIRREGMLAQKGCTPEQEADVLEFIDENKDRLRELSLRLALKAATLRKTDRPNWRSLAVATCCRG